MLRESNAETLARANVNQRIIIIIKTLFTLGLERKIYRNEMIAGKDKKVTQAAYSRLHTYQALLLFLHLIPL